MKENLFYLPPYEDEATAEKIREIYGYPIRYMKQYLLDFFTALYEEQHHIYVLLENLPLDYFAVERTYDRLLYWNNRNGSHEVDGWLYPRERYTLKEFLAKKRTFHRIDEFELVALGTSFTNSKAELPSQKLLKQLYMKFLQEQCERHLRLNTPIRLTPEIINRYGLTKWDAGKIRPYINRFNPPYPHSADRVQDILQDSPYLPKTSRPHFPLAARPPQSPQGYHSLFPSGGESG